MARTISLTQEDPLDRLREFCSQGLYKFHFSWDKFENGIMCELEISYSLNLSSRKVLAKEARFVPGEDIKYAQKVVSAVLLHRLGLGVQEQVDETDQKMQEITEKGMTVAMAALNSMLSAAYPGEKKD